MVRIAYYVTGHGLGHASRSVIVVKRFLECGHTVDVITSVRPAFFEDQMNEPYIDNLRVLSRTLDGGAIQSGPLCVDGIETLKKYHTIHVRHSDLLAAEIAYLQDSHIDIVIADATPIACRAGKAAGCKVVILSNFTWDFCYSNMLAEVGPSLPQADIAVYSAMIAQCSSDYCEADLYLQLPGACPLPPGFDGANVQVGSLLAGHSVTPREAVRDSLGFTSTQGNTQVDKLLLLGFGGHQAEWRLDDSFLPEGWRCVVLGASEEDMPAGGRFKSISFHCFVPDLVHAADCVLGKLGYGFVSECLSNGTPLLFVPRSCWPEEAYLQTFMQSHGACAMMTVDDFSSGQWGPYLQKIVIVKDMMTKALADPQNKRSHHPCPKDVEAVDKIVKICISLLTLELEATTSY
jgi:L-arabinokinase